MKVTENKDLSMTLTDISPAEWDGLLTAGLKELLNRAKHDKDYVLVTPEDPLWEPITEGRHTNVELDDEDANELAQIGVVSLLTKYLDNNQE